MLEAVHQSLDLRTVALGVEAAELGALEEVGPVRAEGRRCLLIGDLLRRVDVLPRTVGVDRLGGVAPGSTDLRAELGQRRPLGLLQVALVLDVGHQGRGEQADHDDDAGAEDQHAAPPLLALLLLAQLLGDFAPLGLAHVLLGHSSASRVSAWLVLRVESTDVTVTP